MRGRAFIVALSVLGTALLAGPALAQHFPKEADEKKVDKALGKAP